MVLIDGRVFTRHARAFEAIRETDRHLAAGRRAFFMSAYDWLLETGGKL